MVRKCSHCGNIGHNSRTCTNNAFSCKVGNGINVNTTTSGGIKLFGVHLDMISSSSVPIKKSFSFDCLSASGPPSVSSPSSSLSSLSAHVQIPMDKVSNGYLSDDPFGRAPPEKRKGVPWTEEEHRAFLIGLEKLGKGDWRGISRKFVRSRTPTQVASHAQKYFLRQSNTCNDKKKRRSSLFDMEFGANNIIVGSQGASSKPRIEMDLNSLEEDQDEEFKMQSTMIKSPDLELTLSAPRSLISQNDSSSTSLLIGAISVT